MRKFTQRKDMSLIKLRETVKDREGWCAAAHGVTKSWALNDNNSKEEQNMYEYDRTYFRKGRQG